MEKKSSKDKNKKSKHTYLIIFIILGLIVLILEGYAIFNIIAVNNDLKNDNIVQSYLNN